MKSGWWCGLCLLAGLQAAALPQALAGEQDLGRLFTTPQERARLDRYWKQARQGEDHYRSGALVTEPAARLLVVNGLLQGSDGRRVVWINGRRRSGKDLLRDGRRVWIAREQPVLLRAGQALDLTSGRILEPYERARAGGRVP